MQQDTEQLTKVENVELEEIAPASSDQGHQILGSDRYLDVVKDVEIKLSALLGNAELTVGELFSLKQGGVIKLNKNSNEPIELELNGQLVARGHLVVVDDNFGIQLSEVCKL